MNIDDLAEQEKEDEDECVHIVLQNRYRMKRISGN